MAQRRLPAVIVVAVFRAPVRLVMAVPVDPVTVLISIGPMVPGDDTTRETHQDADKPQEGNTAEYSCQFTHCMWLPTDD